MIKNFKKIKENCKIFTPTATISYKNGDKYIALALNESRKHLKFNLITKLAS